MASLKTYLVGLTIIIHHLCRYYTKYQASLTQHVNSSSLSSGDKATVLAFLSSIQATCTILELLTGY